MLPPRPPDPRPRNRVLHRSNPAATATPDPATTLGPAGVGGSTGAAGPAACALPAGAGLSAGRAIAAAPARQRGRQLPIVIAPSVSVPVRPSARDGPSRPTRDGDRKSTRLNS